ncbi:MAG: hypothetical protein J6Y54_00700 [Lentisphaeria bacterium]|nr:hypothetical protein [Lentisphaeria bacterium]
MDEPRKKSCFASIFRSRIGLLALFFAAWMLLAVGRAWYIAVPGRAIYVAAGEKMARRTVKIPAPRGRILDAGGRALVWSEHFYDLVSAVPGSGRLDVDELVALNKVIPDMASEDKTLRRNLTPGEVMGLEELIRSGVRVRIVGRNERIAIDSPVVKRLAPGWEKTYDRELAGASGRMSVMLDRKGNWIRHSVKLISPTIRGSDVRLEQTLSELESSGSGGGK